MYRQLAVAFIASSVFAAFVIPHAPAFAQTANTAVKTAAVADKGGAAAGVTAPSLSDIPKDRNGRPKAREQLAACKADANAKGLTGTENREAWIACYRAARPDLAKRFDCRKDARAKGLKDDELRAAVKTCSAAS